MKKIAVILSLGGLSLAMAQCTPKKPKMDGPTFTKEVAIKQYSDAQLMSGKVLFENHCGKCHKLPDPMAFTDVKWNPILNRMVDKSKLNVEDGGLVRAYVVANSKPVQ